MNKRLVAKHLLAGTLSAIVAIESAAKCNAGWPEYKHASHVDKLRNNAWPQPFRTLDATSVASPFEVMRSNGWREFNTLAGTFFDESHHLTDAGMLKLQQVLQTAPTSRKSVFIVRGESPEQTSARLESVEIAISGMIPSGELPPIYVTDIIPSTSSGVYQTMVNRALVKTTPTPRLPAFGNINAPTQQTVAPNAGNSSGK